MQPLQLRSWLHAYLIDQHAARVTEGGQRVRLAALAVQREHQQPVQPLAQRLSRDQRSQFGDERRLLTTAQVRFDPVLKRLQPQLLQAWRVLQDEVVTRHVSERPAAPQ